MNNFFDSVSRIFWAIIDFYCNLVHWCHHHVGGADWIWWVVIISLTLLIFALIFAGIGYIIDPDSFQGSSCGGYSQKIDGPSISVSLLSTSKPKSIVRSIKNTVESSFTLLEKEERRLMHEEAKREHQKFLMKQKMHVEEVIRYSSRHLYCDACNKGTEHQYHGPILLYPFTVDECYGANLVCSECGSLHCSSPVGWASMR